MIEVFETKLSLSSSDFVDDLLSASDFVRHPGLNTHDFNLGFIYCFAYYREASTNTMYSCSLL